MQEDCIHSANNYFLHADEIAKNDPHFCVIFALAFKMLLAKCAQKAIQNTEKFSHIFHKKGLTFALSCCIIIIGKYGAVRAAPGSLFTRLTHETSSPDFDMFIGLPDDTTLPVTCFTGSPETRPRRNNY